MANRTSSSPALTNVVFASNTATEAGGGMANRTSNPALVNLTFSGNTARYGGGMHNEHSSPTLANCILWGNTATSGGDQISNFESAPNVSFSDIEGGYLGTGNISVDPLFVDPDNGDLHLAPGSPCIDAGNNAAPNLPAHDFEGDSRIIDGNRDGSAIVDMGVDEVRLRVYLPLVLRDPVTGIAAGAAN
jgi:hypothetical protein